MMSYDDAWRVKHFLEDPNMKIDKEPYNGFKHSIRIRCYDMILIIHDAEVFDAQDYAKSANDVRIEMQERRIIQRRLKLEALAKRVEKELLTYPSEIPLPF